MLCSAYGHPPAVAPMRLRRPAGIIRLAVVGLKGLLILGTRKVIRVNGDVSALSARFKITAEKVGGEQNSPPTFGNLRLKSQDL
jgi:hypothetical protein